MDFWYTTGADGVPGARCDIPPCRLVSPGAGTLFMEEPMLRWALIFLVVAIIAGIFGFAGVAATSAGIARILFYIFLIVFLVTLVMHLMSGRRVP